MGGCSVCVTACVLSYELDHPWTTKHHPSFTETVLCASPPFFFYISLTNE